MDKLSIEEIILPVGFEISEQVSKIHGITQEKAVREGHHLSTSLSLFSSVLETSDLLVGHNISYDLNVLGCEYFRTFQSNPLIGKSSYCTMQKSTNLLKLPGRYAGNYKWPKLQELYQFLFNEPLSQTHTALDDIRQTAKCYFEMQRREIV
jgi:DNA polymerase III epsilon subunit-like protein